MKIKELSTFLIKYFHSEDFKDQRLGQAICNNFNITDSDIFYEKDEATAISKVYAKYIQIKP
jgi:hypothetical protein